MTAPFAPHPPRLLLYICGFSIFLAIALPFVRRDDWFFLLAIGAFGVVLWTILIWDFARAVSKWWRNR